MTTKLAVILKYNLGLYNFIWASRLSFCTVFFWDLCIIGILWILANVFKQIGNLNVLLTLLTILRLTLLYIFVCLVTLKKWLKCKEKISISKLSGTYRGDTLRSWVVCVYSAFSRLEKASKRKWCQTSSVFICGHLKNESAFT